MDNYASAAGIAKVFPSKTGRRRILIDALAAHELFDCAGHIAEVHLIRYGITRIQRRAIMSAGLLKTILPRELFADNEKPPLRITDVENLMTKFISNAEPLDLVPLGCATLRHVTRAIQGRLEEVHDMILNREIWTGRIRSESRPYAALVVNTEEIRSKLKSEKLLSTREMSVASGLSKELLIAMSSAGEIEHIVERNPSTGKVRRSFKPETAAWARRELVPLTEVARRLGRQGKTLRRRLDDMGIRPYCTVPVTNGELSVYRAAEVDGLTV